jgi:hypothetical protein
MRNAANIAQWTVRITGLLQLLLGLLIWTGAVDQLISLHIASGILLVVALWVLAGLAIGRAPLGQIVVAFVLGLLMPALGLLQEGLLRGGFHWTIQVLHLLIGLAAIGMGEGLGRAIRSAAAPPTAAEAAR